MPSTPPTGKRGATSLQDSVILNLRWAGAGELRTLVPKHMGFVPVLSEGCARHREEKEFGFRGTEGRLLLLQAGGLRIQVAQDHTVSGKAHFGRVGYCT